MRKRRAERLLLRADVALEADVLDDARAALDEARRLDPDAPALEGLERRYEAAAEKRSASEPEVAPRPRRRPVLVGAAAVILLAFGGSFAIKREAVEVQTSPGTPAPNAVATAGVGTTPAAAAAEPRPIVVSTEQVIAREMTPKLLALDATDTAGEATIVMAAAQPQASPASVPTAPAVTRPEPAAPAPRDVPVPALHVSEPGATLNALNTTRLDALPEPPPTVPADRPSADPAPTSRAAAPGSAEPSRLPDAAPRPEPPAERIVKVDEGEGVRTVLARYESAYSSLDAAAAGAVYPAIDRRALSRAFQGLAAQQVSLGDCDVRVMGAAAQAECVGNATWTPKVGGGSRTQSRLWQFDLRRTDDGWQITRATARNQGSN
jgi:hypothetical protein